jgi:hypothetical protein
MIGLESSVLMFPINLVIVQSFRNARPRVTEDQNPGKKDHGLLSLTPSPQPVEDSLLTPEAVTKVYPPPQLVCVWCDRSGSAAEAWGLAYLCCMTVLVLRFLSRSTYVRVHIRARADF